MPKNFKVTVDSFLRNVRSDAAYYAADLLNATLSELFRFEYSELGWINGGLLDIRPEVHAGAQSWSFMELGPTGKATHVADNATDIPLIDLEGARTLRGIINVGCAFVYSEQDLDAAAMQSQMGVSFSIPTEKAAGARYIHDVAVNEYLAFGLPSANVFGALNQPNIGVQPALNGNWATATSIQVLDDVKAARNYVIQISKGTEKPDTIVVSPYILAELDTKPWNQANPSDKSTRQYIEDSMKLKFVEEETLSRASAAGGEAAFFYTKRADKIFGVLPLLLQSLPAQQEGYVHKIPLRSRCGGVGCPKPLGVLLLEGI